jgi:aryl-alcohol dehydrogenase-like predicted oxidoreductase
MLKVDLYQIHWPYSFMRIDMLMNVLADEIEAGKVRAVGVSNYSDWQMRRHTPCSRTAAFRWHPTRCTTACSIVRPSAMAF